MKKGGLNICGKFIRGRIILLTSVLILSGCDNNSGDTTNDTENVIDSPVESGGTNIIQNNELCIISGFEISKKDPSINDFPKVIFSNVENLSGLYIEYDVTFTEDFIKKYKYDESNNYRFALNIFVGILTNGGYYNVFRNQAGGVNNDTSRGLDGAKSGIELKEGVKWKVPLCSDIRIAVNPKEWGPNYAYKTINYCDYIRKNEGNPIAIGGYLSSTKELKGWNLMRINSMKIIYEGPSNSVKLVK